MRYSAPTPGAARRLGGVVFPIPLRFESRTPERQDIVQVAPAADCSIASTLGDVARETVMRLPDRVAIGGGWQDSTTTTICRDSIPMQVTSVRRYRVTGATAVDRAVRLSVERRTTSQLRGEGRQFGESVTVDGAGEGTMRFTLDREDGTIVSGEGEQSLVLRLVGRRRSQEVRQSTRVRITRP